MHATLSASVGTNVPVISRRVLRIANGCLAWAVTDSTPHFGRIAIANADSGAAAYTNVAIDQANRAVQEILTSLGMT
jgi:hypothetical protein